MDIESDGGIRRRVGNNSNNSDDNEVRSYLTQSLEDIPLFRARYSSRISDEQRMELILNELSLVRKEVENKSIETQCKANWFRIINTLSSLVILLSSAVIIGIQAASDCVNIPVIVFSSFIFAMEGTHKMFRWGPQGVLYKHGTIQLKRIMRQTRDYMYMFHRYSVEQMLALISQLRSQYDDIDVGLYKTSMAGVAKFNTGFDVEQQGGSDNFSAMSPSLDLNNRPTPVLPGISNNMSTQGGDSSPHVHIHINGTTPAPSRSPKSSIYAPTMPMSSISAPTMPTAYMPEASSSTPVLVVGPASVSLGSIDQHSGTPGTPRRLSPHKRMMGSAMPTILIEGDNTPPISINKNPSNEHTNK